MTASGAVTELSVGIVDSIEGFHALEPEWRALETQLVNLPFVRFDWVDAWWKHLRQDRLAVRDRLALRTFRLPSSELVGIAPMMITSRPGAGPIRLRQMQCFGTDPNISEIRCIAAPAELQVSAYRALLDHLHSSSESRDWDWVLLTGVPAELTPEALGARYQRLSWLRDLPNYSLTLPPTWSEFKTRLPRNIKESLRKCYNSLKRDGIAFTFDVVTTRAQTAQALAEFFALHRARARREDTVHHPDVFERADARRFLMEVCERFAEQGTLRIFQLKIRGLVVATRIGFAMGSSLYLYYSGYAEEFARYSVMTTTVAEAIQYAIASGFSSVCLSTGSDVSKQRWRPREGLYREVEILAPSIRGRVAHDIFVGTRKIVKRC